jgi:glycosyltransferase involved in cell wall biosynthesis
MPRPTISTLIDTFNHEKYIEQAILSVLEQGLSETEHEIFVIDDGSTDGTPSIVRKFGSRVRYLRKENGGQASAFNAAFPQLSGEVVALLDGDDWWAPGKLPTILDVFLGSKQVAAVGHGYFEVSDSGHVKDVVVPQRSCTLNLSSCEDARLADIGRTLLGTSRLAVRREILKTIGKLPEKLTFCADAPIFTLAFALGGAMILDKPLCYYRLHSGNLFAFGPDDADRFKRRQEMLAVLLDFLPRRLIELGVPPEVVDTFLEADRIELDRYHVQVNGGRLDTFRTELRHARWTQRNPTAAYTAFRAMVSLLALSLPPRMFYRLMSAYGRLDLKRFRSRLGTAESFFSTTFIQRRSVGPDN